MCTHSTTIKKEEAEGNHKPHKFLQTECLTAPKNKPSIVTVKANYKNHITKYFATLYIQCTYNKIVIFFFSIFIPSTLHPLLV